MEYLVEKRYDDMAREREQETKDAPKLTLGEKVRGTYHNIKNVARNAFDNTVGYGIAKYQNRKTRKSFKKGSDKKIVYLVHGVMQNEGSQWRLAKELRKQGYEPVHLKGYHKLPRKESSDKAFEQVDKFHKKAKIKDAEKREDLYSGHSSGGDLGIYMAGDERIKKYGIKKIQARAPAPYGIKGRTIGQKVLMPLAKLDNVKKKLGRRNALEMHERKPIVSIDVIAGKYDQLSTPADNAYKDAENYYIINHPDSTHFGTSGVNDEMNKLFVENLETKKKEKKYMRDYEA